MAFTPQEIENMREALKEHDKKSMGKVIDMSQPVIVPYVYRPFPKVVYKHEGCLPSRFEMVPATIPGAPAEKKAMPPVFETKQVENEEELQSAIAEGWDAKPPVFGETQAKKRTKVA